MRFPLSRRTLLLGTATAIAAGGLSACGLRLDTPPEVPVLNGTQQLRNRIARILAATTPGESDPESAASDLEVFRLAIGPVWNLPQELDTEPVPTEAPRTYVEAAEVVTDSVFTALPDLSADSAAVLIDVAIGFALSAGAVKAEILEASQKNLQSAAESAAQAKKTGASASASPKPSDSDTRESKTPGTETSASKSAILDQARAASYGYERLAVRFEPKSAQREAALDRMETLGSLAGTMQEDLAAMGQTPGQDQPAWTLDPMPNDPDSAATLAQNLEDAMATALLPLVSAEPSSALSLWQSARARSVFAPVQALRFTIEESGGQSAGAKTPATDQGGTTAPGDSKAQN